MPNSVWRINKTTITAQASAAIGTDAFSGGAQTPVEQAGTGNEQGSNEVDCFVRVTVAPGSDAMAQVHIEASEDGATYAKERYCVSAPVLSGETGTFYAGRVKLPAYARFKLFAEDAGLTASLDVTPAMPQIQDT